MRHHMGDTLEEVMVVEAMAVEVVREVAVRARPEAGRRVSF